MLDPTVHHENRHHNLSNRDALLFPPTPLLFFITCISQHFRIRQIQFLQLMQILRGRTGPILEITLPTALRGRRRRRVPPRRPELQRIPVPRVVDDVFLLLTRLTIVLLAPRAAAVRYLGAPDDVGDGRVRTLHEFVVFAAGRRALAHIHANGDVFQRLAH